MEAEKEETQGLKMNPDANIRKPLRARKTMTPSSRKQVELLRNLHELRRSGSSTYSVDNYVQLEMIGTECLNYKSSKETNPDLESKEMSAKEPVAKLVVNSEISIYNSTPDISRGLPYNGCSTDTNMKQFLNAGSLQDLLLNLYEKESDSSVSKPVEVHLYSKSTSQPLGHSEEHKPTTQPLDRLEEHNPTGRPLDHSEEHKPTSRSLDRSEEHSPTGRPLDHSEEHNPTSRPLDRSEEHKTTGQPLDRSEEHKPTSWPLDHSEEYKTISRPLDCSEEHKTTSQLSDCSEEHKPTSRSVDRSEEQKPTIRPSDCSEEHKPTTQPLDSSEEHKTTGRPLDCSEEHKPTIRPSDCSEGHKPTSWPLDRSEEHKPTSLPSDRSEEHKPTIQPLDLSEEHKPTGRTLDCSEEHKPSSRTLGRSEEHKPTSQPLDHSEEHKPTSQPLDRSEEHKPTSQLLDHSEEHKPTSRPLDPSEEHKPTSWPLGPLEEHKTTSLSLDSLEELKPTSRHLDRSEEHKPSSQPLDCSEEHKPTSRLLGRSEEYKPTSRTLGRSEEHKPTSRTLGRSEEHKPTSRTLGRSEEHKPTSRTLGRSEEHKPTSRTLGRSEEHKPTSRTLGRSEEHKPTSRSLGRSEEQTASRSSFSSDTPTLGKTKKAGARLEYTTTEVLKQKLKMFQFREANALPDDALTERRTSEWKERVSCKRVTSSDETGVASSTESERSQSGLEKVRCLIQSHMKNLVGDLDRKLHQLNERVDQTQCLRKHEEITIRIIKKISRLDRHVNSIADLQRAQLSKKVNLQDARSKTTILNVARPTPDSPNDPPVPPKRRSEEQLGEVPSKTARSSAKETCFDVETSDVQARNSAVHSAKTSDVQARNSAVHSAKTSDVQARNSAVHTAKSPDIQARNLAVHSVKTSDAQAKNSADAQDKRASSNARSSVEAPCAPKTKFLIDLTEEEDIKPDVSVKASPPLESITSTPLQPMIEPSEEVPASFPHLPPLPKIRLHPQHMNGFRDTLPPQKLELAVAQIQNPKGIALQWNVKEMDPRCAPIESFHLFICLENKREGTRSRWIKTNEIKAMSLPMACSLSQFAAAGKCYFAMQSKDIFGRFGPFCDIQSITTV